MRALFAIPLLQLMLTQKCHRSSRISHPKVYPGSLSLLLPRKESPCKPLLINADW